MPVLIHGRSALRSALGEATLSSDRSIRAHLHARLSTYAAGLTDVLLLDEFTVCSGIGRIDVVLLNGALHGFEIKSERDSLCRLASQALYFSEVMDFMTLVVVEQFVSNARNLVPSWWGISVVRRSGRRVSFETIRDPEQNPDVNVSSVLELLHRNEAYAILAHAGLERGLRSATKAKISSVLAAALDWPSLHDAVLTHVKLRKSSQLRATHTLNADSYLPSPCREVPRTALPVCAIVQYAISLAVIASAVDGIPDDSRGEGRELRVSAVAWNLEPPSDEDGVGRWFRIADLGRALCEPR